MPFRTKSAPTHLEQRAARLTSPRGSRAAIPLRTSSAINGSGAPLFALFVRPRRRTADDGGQQVLVRQPNPRKPDSRELTSRTQAPSDVDSVPRRSRPVRTSSEERGCGATESSRRRILSRLSSSGIDTRPGSLPAALFCRPSRRSCRVAGIGARSCAAASHPCATLLASCWTYGLHISETTGALGLCYSPARH